MFARSHLIDMEMCTFLRGEVMKLPKGTEIPALVFGLELIMVIGFALIFLVLAPR